MGQEELHDQPEHHRNETTLSSELAALSARVEILERELAALRDRRDDRGTESAAVIASVQSPPPISSASVVVERIVPPLPYPSSPEASASFENKLGAQIFNRIGVVALLIGATWFLKLAMDNHWIGPIGRIVAGLIAGAGVIVWSERFRRKGLSRVFLFAEGYW